jgi:hypothetical protein
MALWLWRVKLLAVDGTAVADKRVDSAITATSAIKHDAEHLHE